jgi:hypothetical protein
MLNLFYTPLTVKYNLDVISPPPPSKKKGKGKRKRCCFILFGLSSGPCGFLGLITDVYAVKCLKLLNFGLKSELDSRFRDSFDTFGS